MRNKNFLEVATGYDAQTAMDEALRCLHCKHKPCISGCPVQIHIPDFIAKVAEGDFEAAYQIISESSSCRQSVAGCVPRSASARVNACGALRATR